MPGKLGASRSKNSLSSALGGAASATLTSGHSALAASSRSAKKGYNTRGPLWCTTDSSKRPPPLWTLAANERLAASPSRHSPEPEVSDVFAEERSELQSLWKGTDVNRFFEPIQKIPRHTGPVADPRKIYGDKEPSCYTGWGERRHVTVMRRWDSLPQLGGQLNPDFLDTISDYKMRLSGPPPPESAAEAAVRRGRERRADRRAAGDSEIREHVPSPGSSKRKEPLIECTCCEHDKPKPWLQQLAFLDEVSSGGGGPGKPPHPPGSSGATKAPAPGPRG